MPGTVNDPANKKTRQVDVAAFGVDDDGREALPQRAQPDSAEELADRRFVDGARGVAHLGEDLRRALLRAHARGARLVTICSGVFALARTGLLDSRSATTHWARAEQLRREFPQVRVEPDRLYVDHGDVATSAGAGAGIDLCLHLVRRDHGAAHAALLARHMVMPPHREGGQAQYALPSPPVDALDGLLEWAGARLGTPLAVGDLAAHLSTLLEETDLPVEASASPLRSTFAAASAPRWAHPGRLPASVPGPDRHRLQGPRAACPLLGR